MTAKSNSLTPSDPTLRIIAALAAAREKRLPAETAVERLREVIISIPSLVGTS